MSSLTWSARPVISEDKPTASLSCANLSAIFHMYHTVLGSETEHVPVCSGTFNSWDRREWFFSCALSGSSLSGNCLMPKTIRTQHNMFIGPAGWNMDHDDVRL